MHDFIDDQAQEAGKSRPKKRRLQTIVQSSDDEDDSRPLLTKKGSKKSRLSSDGRTTLPPQSTDEMSPEQRPKKVQRSSKERPRVKGAKGKSKKSAKGDDEIKLIGIPKSEY